jgi:hypothetical protein
VEPEFSPPRESPPVDADAVMAMVPRGTMIKRVFVDIALAQPGPFTPLQLLDLAGVQLPDCGPFENVDWHDYFRVMLCVAAHTHGSERVGAGLRAIGRRFYPVIIKTPAGKLMLGRQLGDAVRNVADTWQQFNTLGRVWSEPIDERGFEYHFEHYPMILAETVGVGVFEGTFKYHHMPLNVMIASTAADNAIMHIRW